MLKETGLMRRLVRKFGRRGVLLALIGLMWIVIGVEFATTPTRRFSSPGGPLEFFDDITSPWLGLVWIVGGAVAVVCAFVRPWSGRDDYGFLGLTVPVFGWFALWTVSWATSVVTGGLWGRSTAWIGALIYLVVLGLILFITRWPDPDDPYVRRRSE